MEAMADSVTIRQFAIAVCNNEKQTLDVSIYKWASRKAEEVCRT
jgi:hypothetical protein